MPNNNIILKAKLQAYSRAPFYGDYIRNPKSLLKDGYDPSKYYVFKDGSWINLEEASSKLGLSIEELSNELERVETTLNSQLENIDCYFDYNSNKIIFTNKFGVSQEYVLPSTKVDRETIGLNNALEATLLDRPDGETLRVVDVEYESDDVRVVKKSGKLRVDALYTGKDNQGNSKYISGVDVEARLSRAEKNIKDIESFTQGTGGFLDPYNFGESLAFLSINVRNQKLNSYTYDQLFQGEVKIIPDQTKIKNLYTGNIWVYIQESNSWVNEGQDTIVTATNDGVLGAVTGSSEKFKISIEKNAAGQSTGIMSVNGLEEEFAKVMYKFDGDEDNSQAPSANSYVMRTSTGAIRASEATQDYEVINLKQFKSLMASLQIPIADISSMVDLYYTPITNSGGNN